MYLFTLLIPTVTLAQPPEAIALEQLVYKYNNKFLYDSANLAINSFLDKPGLSPENKYYGYLYRSYTFKRLFDYPSTLASLDSAYTYGLQTSNPTYFANNVICQKAYAYFDTRKYRRADSLMNLLRQQNYQHLNEENLSKILMQEAYLLYLNKNYQAAEERYSIALKKMQASSMCDIPMIYAKLIELYSAMQLKSKMYSTYNKAIACADSCGILKYKLYTNEVMAAALAKVGDYKQAIFYNGIRDSLQEIYNYEANQEKINELETKYKAKSREQQISFQQRSIRSKNLQILLLILSVAILAIGWMYYLLKQRQKKIEQDKKNAHWFTTQLLHKTEEDRKRIAGHLHDSINHELLSLKHMLQNKDENVQHRIDLLIEDVRQISHHLHPVVFSRVGLAHSISQLVERVQAHNNFMLTADVNYQKALSLEAELQLYRIIQEAVTNMVKHSNAVAGKIIVEQTPLHITVEIKDNGGGFDVEEMLNSDKAFGLYNIIERSRTAGGYAQIKSDKQGTIITIKIPLNQS